MEKYGSISGKGYRIEAYLPTVDDDPLEWLLQAYKGDDLIKEMRHPLIHETRWGVDAEDLITLETLADKLLDSLD